MASTEANPNCSAQSQRDWGARAKRARLPVDRWEFVAWDLAAIVDEPLVPGMIDNFAPKRPVSSDNQAQSGNRFSNLLGRGDHVADSLVRPKLAGKKHHRIACQSALPWKERSRSTPGLITVQRSGGHPLAIADWRANSTLQRNASAEVLIVRLICRHGGMR